MKSEKIANWLQIVANLGIVGGLVLLAFQINQTAEVTRQDLQARNFEMNTSQLVGMFGEKASDAWQKAFFSPESLTAEELTVVYYLLDHRRDIDGMAQSLLVEPNEITDDWKHSLRWHAINTYGANEISKMWWQSFNHSEEAWSRYVNEIISDETADSELEDMRRRYCTAYPENSMCLPNDTK